MFTSHPSLLLCRLTVEHHLFQANPTSPSKLYTLFFLHFSISATLSPTQDFCDECAVLNGWTWTWSAQRKPPAYLCKKQLGAVSRSFVNVLLKNTEALLEQERASDRHWWCKRNSLWTISSPSNIGFSNEACWIRCVKIVWCIRACVWICSFSKEKNRSSVARSNLWFVSGVVCLSLVSSKSGSLSLMSGCNKDLTDDMQRHDMLDTQRRTLIVGGRPLLSSDYV